MSTMTLDSLFDTQVRPPVRTRQSGAVRLTRVQREGKAAQAAADLLKGFPLPAGSVLAPKDPG